MSVEPEYNKIVSNVEHTFIKNNFQGWDGSIHFLITFSKLTGSKRVIRF